MAPKRIIIDVERMKYPNTGLYYFCYHLGKWLSIEKNVASEELHFYGPAEIKNIFGTDVSYQKQNNLHKIYYPKTTAFNIWHSLYQGTEYFPFNKKVKKVLTIHDLNFLHDEKKNEEKKKKYLSGLQKKVNNSNHIVTVSQFVLNEVKAHLNIANTNCSVIYNGCSIEEIKGLENPAVPPDKKFLFTIGTVVEKKNFHVLPALLVDNDWRLIITGNIVSKQYQQVIINEAAKYKVENRVIFTGSVTENDKQWYYKNCEAFVFPSIAEGFGLPVVEAMYFGKPVLLSNHTSLPEIGGQLAYYFNSFNAEDMRATMHQSLEHYKQQNTAKAIQQHASTFSWQNAAKQYLHIYRNL